VAFGQVIDYAITSLRDVGGYQGRVFVMTDQERCFAHLRERDARKGAETITIHVEPPQDSLRDSINNVNLRRTRFRMLKTQLLEYLPHDVRFAVFLDSDVLTTKEDCVDGFLAQNAAGKTLPRFAEGRRHAEAEVTNATRPPQIPGRTRWPSGCVGAPAMGRMPAASC